MLKSLITILCISMCMVGCQSTKTNTNDNTNPLINNGSENYVPWWVTNNVSSTNGVNTNVNIH